MRPSDLSVELSRPAPVGFRMNDHSTPATVPGTDQGSTITVSATARHAPCRLWSHSAMTSPITSTATVITMKYPAVLSSDWRNDGSASARAYLPSPTNALLGSVSSYLWRLPMMLLMLG